MVGTGSSEITVILDPQKLERFVDPTIGANVLRLDKCFGPPMLQNANNAGFFKALVALGVLMPLSAWRSG